MPDNLWSVVAGGAIAIASTYFGSHLQTVRTNNEVLRKDYEEIFRLRKSLLSELRSCIEQYRQSVGVALECVPPGAAFLSVFNVRENYFNVFDSNIKLLGGIVNDDERMCIIKTYVMMKSLIETYHVNNVLVDRFNSAQIRLGLSEDVVDDVNVRSLYAALVGYCEKLKFLHFQTLQQVNLAVSYLEMEMDPPKIELDTLRVWGSCVKKHFFLVCALAKQKWDALGRHF